MLYILLVMLKCTRSRNPGRMEGEEEREETEPERQEEGKAAGDVRNVW